MSQFDTAISLLRLMVSQGHQPLPSETVQLVGDFLTQYPLDAEPDPGVTRCPKCADGRFQYLINIDAYKCSKCGHAVAA